MNKRTYEYEILNYVAEGLFQKTLEQCGIRHLIPDNSSDEKIRDLCRDKARSLIDTYNNAIFAEEIKEIVVKDCKDALLFRTTIEKIFESGLLLSSLVLTIILTVIALAFNDSSPETLSNNLKIISSLCLWAVPLVMIQLGLNIVLKIRQ